MGKSQKPIPLTLGGLKSLIGDAPKYGNETFELGGYIFELRRLSGSQWRETLAAGMDSVFVLLKNGLINPESATGEGFSDEIIRDFIDKRPIASDRVAGKIESITNDMLVFEQKALGLAEKNSQTTGTKEQEGNIADSTT